MVRASFGTTKYCNAFLRHAPCTNPDCLYLHTLGDDEVPCAATITSIWRTTRKSLLLVGLCAAQSGSDSFFIALDLVDSMK